MPHGSFIGRLPGALLLAAEAFVKRLEEAGVDVQLLELDTADHYSIYPNAPSFPEIAGAVVEFAGKLGTK